MRNNKKLSKKAKSTQSKKPAKSKNTKKEKSEYSFGGITPIQILPFDVYAG